MALVRLVRLVFVAAALSAMLLLGGCFGLGGPKSTTGTLRMSLVDSATNDLSEVNVRITKVEVNRDGKWETLNAFTNQGGFLDVNLLDLRFDQALLGEKSLPAGAYSQIRLIVDEFNSNVVLQGSTTHYPLKVPSGPQTGLKIDHPFIVPAGGAVALVLDADITQFVHENGSKNEYIMSPTAVRVVDLQSGNIAGKVLAKATNQAITAVDVAVTVWLDNNNDGVKDDPTKYVAGTLALRELLDGHVAGEFQVNAVPALLTGRYIVEVRATGYQPMTISGVVVTPGVTTVIDGDNTTPVADPILLAAATATATAQ